MATKRRNVEQGFYDATGFHPIRASRDYDDSVDYDSESYSKSKRSYGRRNPKPPTRKQLAARKRFAAAAKARSRDIAAQKRAAGYRKVGGVWVAPKQNSGKARKAKAQRRGFSTYKTSVFGSGEKRKRAQETLARRDKKRAARLARTRKPARLKKIAARKAQGLDSFLGGLTVRKNGRRLYGAAAAAVLAKRAGGKKRGTLLANGKRRNGIFRTAARQAIAKRLTQPIRFGRKRHNPGAPADIAAMHETFLGRPTKGHFEITAPQGTPKDVAVLGSLVCLKTEDEDFEFDKGEAYLGADGRGNLYVLGDTAPVETNTNFGHIEEIRYEAKKDHLNPFHWRRRKSRRNSSNVEYFHYFGEEDGVMPKLKSDGDGLLHISGGNYTVEAEGIIN
jgi:hypothetical protein